MKLSHGLHLAYCTNIHRGETWADTFANLQRHTLAVRRRTCPNAPYAIGLRLGDGAARELSEASTLAAFQRWLDEQGCYVFTINGFPFGQFHGTRVKEQVYAPDWTNAARLEYTNRLFDVLAQLLPPGVAGSVSTVPGSFKAFIQDPHQAQAMRDNLWRCVEHIARLSDASGRELHLGLEPEPLCYLETSEETVRFFEKLRSEHPRDQRLDRHLGVNYDACHLAVEFEEPQAALGRLRTAGIRLSKLHLSSALSVIPSKEVRQNLAAFADDVYLHQVIARAPDGTLTRYRDLDLALADAERSTNGADSSGRKPPEWRIHFHVPLHNQPSACFDPGIERHQLSFEEHMGTSRFGTTIDHLRGVLDVLAASPCLCSHLEMETYTWEVLPPELKNRNVVDQLAAEYAWTLGELAKRGIGRLV